MTLICVLGCYLSLGNLAQAKALLDQMPQLLDRRKLGGRDLPTEVYIRKKRESFAGSYSDGS
jgi:hypothetical protein